MKIIVKTTHFAIINIVKVPEAAQMPNKPFVRTQLFIVVTITIMFLSTLSPHSVNASISQSFTYQGKIVNTEGTNLKNTDAACIDTGIADTCDFRVSLYTASGGGILVWQQTVSNVELYDNNGIFNLLLDCSGDFSACNQNGGPDFTSGQLFIQVEFDTNGNGDFAEGETFNPRRQLTASPYAFNAKTADMAANANMLGGTSPSSFLRSDADDSFDTGYTISVNGTMDINGDLIVSDRQLIFDGLFTEFTLTGDLTINTDDLVVDKETGFIGIGNTAPSVAIDIAGSFKSTGNMEVQGFTSLGGGTAPNANAGLWVNYNKTFTDVGQQLLVSGTVTGADSKDVYGMRVDPLSITIPTGTTNLAASLYINEPNITKVGTLTNTASIYIATAATEGNNNYALWVDSGAVRIDDGLTVGSDLIINGTTAATSNIFLGNNGAVVINEQGNDSDFRIDGNGGTVNTALLFVDASAQSIGVHTSAPTAYIDLPASGDRASARIRTGTTPSSYNEGDVYSDGNSLYFRNNSTWIDLTSGSSLQSTYTGGQTIDVNSTEGALTFDLVSSNFDIKVGEGTDTGDFRVWDGATNTWLNVDESANAVSIGNNGVSTALSLSSNTWDIDTAGAVSGITTLASSGDWTWSATTPTITINNTETFTITDGTDNFAVNTNTGTLSFTNSVGGYSFSTSTGPSYSGTARPTKSITLSPEYPGATLTPFYGAGTDVNISGTMSSDTDTNPASSIRNYYNWNRGAATQHFYTVAVRVTLPQDFSEWPTNDAVIVNYQTANATSSNSLVDVRIYKEGNGTLEASSLNNASVTWAQTAFTKATLDLWNGPGQTAVIYLRLGSQGGNYAKVGDIVLNYLAKY